MTKSLNETLAGINNMFPKEQFQPSPLDIGVAEQLRDIAAQVETGSLRIKHFALTVNEEGGQKLELEAD